MHYALRWWETLGKSERIVAMSLAAGSVVAIANSTVWAVAVGYMAKQKARIAIAECTHADEQSTPTDATNNHTNSHLSANADARSSR